MSAMGWLIAGGAVVVCGCLALVGWACIHVGARSEREYEEARRIEEHRRKYGGRGYEGIENGGGKHE